MHETKKILLDYETPLPADDRAYEQGAPVSTSVRLRRLVFAAGVALLVFGFWHIVNHQIDGRTEMIYGGLLAGLSNPFFRLGKK